MKTNSRNTASSNNYSRVKFFAVIFCALLVAACGGRKTVVTQDDSAEYREARTLPPLIKPSDDSTPGAEQSIQQTGNDVAVTSNGSVAASQEGQPLEVKETVRTSSDITTRVVDKTNGTAELVIEADYDRAWAFTRRNLKKSDITVHSRNKAAGRVLIGCSGIDGTDDAARKKGSWSIFKRSKKEQLEHCALQLVGSKTATSLTVLNRKGQSVNTDAAKQIFTRLLNN